MAIFKALLGLFSRRYASTRAAPADRDEALSHHEASFRTNLRHIVTFLTNMPPIVTAHTSMIPAQVTTKVDLAHAASGYTNLTHDVKIIRRG